jgi:branched-chain amino acid transport system substrate-binding protein
MRRIIVALVAAALAPAAVAQNTVKVGVVTFLSGPAASPFGVPAKNAAELVAESLNKGTAPKPYEKRGFGGADLELVFVDEAGSTTTQVTEFRNLVQRANVDLVIGYVSSGNCLAIAPVAEELKKLVNFFDCGTPRIFEDGKYNYVFRTAAHATMDNVALARYLKMRNVKVERYNMINQDYAWGQDSKKDFTLAMANLYKDAKVDADLLPKFGAGQYGTEVSALQSKPADILHSSLWGGDLQAFILQAGARGVFAKQTPVFSAADHVLPSLGEKMPNGAILGARGAYGLMSPKSPLNDWWWDLYSKAYNVYPVQAPYRMVQAMLGLKLAAEKAMAANGGKKPTPEQLAAALTGSTWESPAGPIRMVLGDGHQAIQETAIGRTRWDAGKKMVLLEDIQRFPAECVNPPANMKSEDWLKAGMPGAKC